MSDRVVEQKIGRTSTGKNLTESFGYGSHYFLNGQAHTLDPFPISHANRAFDPLHDQHSRRADMLIHESVVIE